MTTRFGLLLGKLRGSSHGGRTLGGFFDSLLQSFENCRVGLSDEMLRGGERRARPFFADIYEKEKERLKETIRLYEAGLPEAGQEEVFQRTDELVGKVLLPAYSRLATDFTLRERNDFYLLPARLHGLERFFWGVVGMGLGFFVVWAPFIPIWGKEWVLPFVVGGLLFPEIRRYFAQRRYQGDLNRIVASGDAEIWRMEVAELTSPGNGQALSGAPGKAPHQEAPRGGLGTPPRERQGGR